MLNEWLQCVSHMSPKMLTVSQGLSVPLTLGTFFFSSSELDRNKEGNSSKFFGSWMKGSKGQNCDFFSMVW